MELAALIIASVDLFLTIVALIFAYKIKKNYKRDFKQAYQEWIDEPNK